MRAAFLLLPAMLMGQTPPPKPKAAKPAAVKSSAPKPSEAKAVSSRKAAPAKPKAASQIQPMTDEEKTIYSLGLSMYRSLGQFDLSPSELELVKQALSDAAAGKPAVDLNAWSGRIQSLVRERAGRLAEREKAASLAYMEKAANEPGAVRTGSGLVYREVVAGSGAHPAATDTVRVHYRGTLVNGTEFDSSYARNEPAEFALNAVIPCWTEGVQKMGVGGKAVLVCPSNLAYGDAGRPSIPGGAALIFEVELLGIVAKP
jgi:FKBP-type peptidyl-prolyl cis-trans isomerase FkpA